MKEKLRIRGIGKGQKIPAFCLEILREFLNYETNEYKLLQIVIFGQKEFEGTIRKYPNFTDRINLYHMLKPLNFRDTRLMIQYRLQKSSNSPHKVRLFTWPALWAIFRISGGYPRKIINLCHQSILSMIIQNRSKSGYFLVHTCARRVFPEESNRRRLFRAGSLATAAVAIALLIFLFAERLTTVHGPGNNRLNARLAGETRQGPGPPAADSGARIPPDDFKRHQPDENESAGSFKTNKSERSQKSAESLQPHNITAAVPGKEPPDTEVPTVDKDTSRAFKVPQDRMLTMEKYPATAGESVTNPHRKQSTEPIIEDTESPVPASVPKRLRNNKSEKRTAASYSAILGRLNLEPNETLSRIIRGVYGRLSSRYYKSIINANPDIVDPDRVEVGQTINLPAIPARVKPLKTPVWWVKIDDRESLEAAYNLVRNRSKSLPDMRLIPHWNPSGGTRFAVVLNRLFRDEYSARNYLQRLPANLASKSTVLSRWDNETIYFSNPYFN